MAKPPGVANGQLTELQRGFVVAFVRNGGNATQAAEAAGYKYERLDRAGHDALKSTAVQAAIQSEIRRALSVDLAGLALGVVRGILEDVTMEPKIRLDAAKVALDRGGYVAPKAADASSDGLRELHEMSVQELETFLQKAKSNAANAAPVIDLDATEVIDAGHLL
jgi:phage terminase small subunit